MYIKKLTLKNIKSFKDVTFDFTRPDGSLAGWSVFVGGNGSGKTTVLRAIAVALMGPTTTCKTNGWIRSGENEGHATISVSWDQGFDSFRQLNDVRDLFPDGDFDLGVEWARDNPGSENDVFRGGDVLRSSGAPAYRHAPKQGPRRGTNRGWFLAGYGPLRRLTGNAEEANWLASLDERSGRVITLFLESAALSEGEELLRTVHARSLEENGSDRARNKRFLDGARSLLEDGLLPHGFSVSRVTVDAVFITDASGFELPLDDASDGCRAIVAVVIDLLVRLQDAYGDLLEFSKNHLGRTQVTLPGVVLIDEAEAHLHPAWQRELPAWFKTHFPNIQFIVSTHSPLIAQAADPNGLFILPGHGDSESAPRRASTEELERIRLGTAFHTLLESAFGLYTTRSPWAAEQIAHWQELNAKEKAGVALTQEERRTHAELRRLMDVAFREPNTPVSV